MNLDCEGYIDSINSIISDIVETFESLQYPDIYCDVCSHFSKAKFNEDCGKVIDIVPLKLE